MFYAYRHKGAIGSRYLAQITQGCYWAHSCDTIGGSITLKRVPLDEFSPADDKRRGFPEPEPTAQPSPKWDRELVPLEQAVEELRRKSIDVFLNPVRYACLPTAKDTFLLFILQGGSLVVWKCENEKWSEKPIENIPTDIAEPFAVYPGPDGAYFIATCSSGKIFYSPRPSQGKRELRGVWTDAASPVRFLVADAGSGKTFAFTQPAKDAKNGKNVYFELAETVKPANYDVKPEKPNGPVIDTVAQYARFLVAEKKIKGE